MGAHSFFDEFPITVIVASEGDEGSDNIKTFIQGSSREKNDHLFPDETEDGLVGGNGREVKVLVITQVGGGRDVE